MTRSPRTTLAVGLATGVLVAGLPGMVPAAAVPASATPASATPASATPASATPASAIPAATVNAVADSPPLRVTIDSLTPSTIPGRGRITVTGQVTNRSPDSWTGLNVYLQTSSEPVTSSAGLEQAFASDPATSIGDRLTGPGQYTSIGDLASGESTRFRLTVRRDELQISGRRGVYWLGVQVLGASSAGRDVLADGRARAPIPLMRRNPSATLALVLPIRAPVRRNVDGTLRGVARWQRLLAPQGRLTRLTRLSGTAGAVPLTWVVDPAVLEAARSVAAGNPPRSIAPSDQSAPRGSATSPTPSPTPSPSESSSASGQQSPGTSGSTGNGPAGPAEGPAAAQTGRAADWLADFRNQAGRRPVLSVPFGDADVAALFRRRAGGLYQRAAQLSAATMGDLGVLSGPVVAPPNGYLPPVALRRLDAEVPVLLSDAAVNHLGRTVIEPRAGQRVMLGTSSLGTLGAGPPAARRALLVRQRVLSTAAVRALSGGPGDPLVVSLPQQWDPGRRWRRADFFAGLEVPWLRTVDLSTAVVLAGGAGPYHGPIAYPATEAKAELPRANIVATQQLSRTGSVLADLLTRNDTVDDSLTRAALLASSYAARLRPAAAVAVARRTTNRIRELMAGVRIDGPSFVILSSNEGPALVTVVNGLDEPVTVGVRASTSSGDLVIRSPDPVDLGPGQRASVRLRASAADIGVYSVTVVPVTSRGRPIGPGLELNVRSSQVGLVIWVVMGLGAVLLVATLSIRIARRMRPRTPTPGPLPRTVRR